MRHIDAVPFYSQQWITQCLHYTWYCNFVAH